MRILFAGTELFPHVKEGGLADVLAALPKALRNLGADARLLLPGYPALMRAAAPLEPVLALGDLMGGGQARVLLGRSPAGLPLYLLDQPSFFDHGRPYGASGDLALRFGALSWSAAHLGRHGDGQGWKPEIVHAHDWPTALAPAYLALEEGPRPRTVLTIHNLAYQGLFPADLLAPLGLPASSFHPDGLEFYGKLGFLKAGLVYADRLATVSPTYAQEILGPEGLGLEGLLQRRNGRLRGILNGVDDEVWNPATDAHLPRAFGPTDLAARTAGKLELQRELGLRVEADQPLFAIVSRFAAQKGLDLVLENQAWFAAQNAQLAVLGQGDPELEARFLAAARLHPSRVVARIGFDEGLSHRLYGGADAILVPSRQEPCGLTQLYALRYGALPVVRATGGLADTVVDASPEAIRAGHATGFVFREASPAGLAGALERTLTLYRDRREAWTGLQKRGMAQDLGWSRAAREYLDLYEELLRSGD